MKLLLLIGTFVVMSQYVLGRYMLYYDIDSPCGQTVYASFDQQIRVQLSSYNPNKQCLLKLHSESTDKFMVYIRSMSIKGTSGICNNNWFEVHDGFSRQSSPLFSTSRLCGYSAPGGVYRTTGSDLTFYFQSSFYASYSSIDVVVTPYHSGFCNVREYDCSNGRCIDDSLTCSGYNPCGDYSDCDHGDDTISVGVIAGGIVGGIVFILCVAATIRVIVCRRRWRMIERRPLVVNTTTVATGVPPPYNQNYGSVQPAGAVNP